MTREEKIRILEEAQERAFKQIANTDGRAMGTKEFTRLLSVAHQLSWMAYPEETIPRDAETIVPDEVQNTTVPAEIVPGEVQPTISKDEVMTVVKQARSKGVPVAKIIQKFGASLPELDPKDYPKVIQAIKAAETEAS